MSKTLLLATTALMAVWASGAMADDGRCCQVEKGSWWAKPATMSPEACVALGPSGAFAPQGTPGAKACASQDKDSTTTIIPNPQGGGGGGSGSGAGGGGGGSGGGGDGAGGRH